MQEYYEILGLNENATDEEIEQAYKNLKSKYQNDMFLEGDKGNEAAKNLTKIENAYYEIKSERANKTNSQKTEFVDYGTISNAIKEGKLDVAQTYLDNITERDAEWHYLQSVIFYKKNWTNESKKQLEIAMSMDKNNEKYKDSYQKLLKKMQYNEQQFRSGNESYSAQGKQMGGDECGSMADCCATWCCMNLLCNACCR